MPESRKRRKAAYTPPPNATGAPVRKKGPSPRWVPGLMLVLFGIGVVWLVLYYISPGSNMFGLPGVSGLGNWNLLIGFAFIVGGFGVATQWR